MQYGCAYYNQHLVARQWCDPEECVACWQEAKTPYETELAAAVVNGSAKVDVSLPKEGGFDLLLEIVETKNNRTFTCDGTSDIGVVARPAEKRPIPAYPDGSEGGDAPEELLEPPKRVVIDGSPTVLNGTVRGSVRVVGLDSASPPVLVLLDVYAAGENSAVGEVRVGSDPVDFAIPLSEPEGFRGKTIRIDAYVSPLPLVRDELFFSQEYDYSYLERFGDYYGEGPEPRVYKHLDLTSATVPVPLSYDGRECTRKTTFTNNVSASVVTSGGTVAFSLEADMCAENSSVSLLLVDAGVLQQDTYVYPLLAEHAPALAPATSYTGRIKLQDNAGICTGVSPTRVTSFPANITIAGWGLAEADSHGKIKVPEVTVGGLPCVVTELRRLFVQHSTKSGRGRFVRWVGCVALGPGDVTVKLPSDRPGGEKKPVPCVGSCNIRLDPPGLEIDEELRNVAPHLCDRWIVHSAQKYLHHYGVKENEEAIGSVIGIKMGETSSLAAIYKYGKVEMIGQASSSTDGRAIPSYVAIEPTGKTHVGEDALLFTDRIFGMMQMLGRKENDTWVLNNRAERWPFPMCSKEGKLGVEVVVDQQAACYSGEELVGLLLKQLRVNAEELLGEEVRHCVIAVPTSFNDAQRKGVVNAAALAGLETMRIINEPTAAAISYGLDKRGGERLIVVVDIGGTVLDVTLLSVDNGVFEILSSKSDPILGGKDLDACLTSYFLEKINKTYGEKLCGPKTLRWIKREVERVKHQLSSKWNVKLEIETFDDVGDSRWFSATLSRARFQDIVRDLLERVIPLLDDTMVGFNKSEVDDLILVGGSSKIPLFQLIIERYFDEGRGKWQGGISPEEAVAYGAAVQAGIFAGSDDSTTKDILLLDITPLNLGITVNDEESLQVVISRNSVIPTQKTVTVILPAHTDTAKFHLWEGASMSLVKNVLVGDIEMNIVNSGANTEIDVTLLIDAQGIVTLEARVKGSERATKKMMARGKPLREEEIEYMLREAEEGGTGHSLFGAQVPPTTKRLRGGLPKHVVRERLDFRESIVLPPIMMTKNARGNSTAEIIVRMPDAITSWDVKAVLATTQELRVVSLEQPVVVRNPVFSQTTTPPFLTLGDSVLVSTIVENTLPSHWVRDIEVSLHLHADSKIKACADFPVPCVMSQTIDGIEPGSRKAVWWRINASKVGNAELNTTVTVTRPSLFTESSTLQQPMRVVPPGIPRTNAYHSGGTDGDLAAEFTVDDDAVFAIGVLNMVPFSSGSVALGGVEALSRYPYGCCEQTSAGTHSNLVALKYLSASRSTDRELRDLLLSNLRSGRERLVSRFRRPSGGFTMWADDEGDGEVFMTAVALGVLGGMTEFTPVDPTILNAAGSFLRSRQNSDGSYDDPSTGGEFHGSSYDATIRTAYALHNQLVAEIEDSAAFRYLVARRDDLDSCSLAMLTLAAHRSSFTHQGTELLTRLKDKALCSNGLCHWDQGKCISSSIESTAYAIAALVAAGQSSVCTLEQQECAALTGDGDGDMLAAATRWLLRKRTTQGWRTTIDTLWAAWALTARFESPGVVVQGEGNMTITLDGELVREIEVTNRNRRAVSAEMRSLYIPLGAGGTTHKVVVGWHSSSDAAIASAPHSVLEVHTYAQQRDGGEGKLPLSPSAEWVFVTHHVGVARPVSKADPSSWSLPVHITISPNSSNPRTAIAGESVMVEIPIPSTTSLPNDAYWAMVRHPEVRHVEINNNGGRQVLALFLRNRLNSLPIDFALEFVGKGDVFVSMGAVRVLPMYHPEYAVSAMAKSVKVGLPTAF